MSIVTLVISVVVGAVLTQLLSAAIAWIAEPKLPGGLCLFAVLLLVSWCMGE